MCSPHAVEPDQHGTPTPPTLASRTLGRGLVPPTCSRWLLLLAAAALLAACGTRPVAPLAGSDRDGPGANPPPNLHAVPDAEPRVEPLRAGGPNKPYAVFGQTYVPLAADLPLRDSGGASWYGRKFHGKPTASGEPYDMYAMTAAHKTMPLPSYARVRNPANGREVVVRVNDRGPFASGRVIDLSYTAALKLGLLSGVAPVEVQRLTHDEIRSGRWRGPATAEPLAAAPVATPRVDPAALLPPDDPAPGDAPLSQPTPSAAAQPHGWWLQLGAFRARDAALALLQRLQAPLLGDAVPAQASAPPAQVLAVFDDAGLFRVQAVAERLRVLLGSAPLVLERR